MLISVPKETSLQETRVASSPEVVAKLKNLGFEILVEKNAGISASFSDAAFVSAGARIAANYVSAVKNADIILKVTPPQPAEIAKIKKGATLISHMNALTNKSCVDACVEQKLTSFAMELMPRISRAQSMDILSSQSNLSGYRAVLEGAAEYGRSFSMMMTAAGTIPPAKVFIMGVGVAGLQAIATAKRLGAIVTATDVRPATKEQVTSLGGKFLEIDKEMEKEAETGGGYAKEMPREYLEKQKKIVADHIAKQDIVITTALIPGRIAPTLVTANMVQSMQRGAVIVDMAIEAGGNCEGAKYGEIFISPNGIKIIGYHNLATRLPETASNLFSKNIFNFLEPHVDKEKKVITFNWEDETVAGTVVTKGGKIVNDLVKNIEKTKTKPHSKKNK